MTLTKAKRNNLIVFTDWMHYGCPEAYDELNDSNRELIKAYAEEFPAAMALKINLYTEDEKKTSGIFKIANAENLYVFCCNYIFDGTAESFEKVKAAVEKWRKGGSINDLNKLDQVIQEANGIIILWS